MSFFVALNVTGAVEVFEMFGQKNSKAYLEITNVCNLFCSFCHGTSRKPRFMTLTEFETAARKLRPYCEYLYLHLMGEPLLHPQLGEILECAADLNFKVILTTNGTLLGRKSAPLLGSKALFKVSVSIHSFDVNDMASLGCSSFDDYFAVCSDFCDAAAERGVICVYRLWNNEGDTAPEVQNAETLAVMRAHYPGEWKKIYSGYRLSESKIFLEWGKRFEWPDAAPEKSATENHAHSCYGLCDQIGVLCDGSIVPCCLDADGAITLGNIFTDSIDDVLSSPRAVALRESFEKRTVAEPLCLHCGYAARYK